jgi:hypothetical protein
MSFKGQIAAFNKKAEKAATMIFRGTALDLFGRIIRRTPVDTGRLRGNWQAGINSPADGGGNKAIGVAGIGDSVFITNNLPYAIPIEEGSSTQAPKGIVAVTVAEFKSVVKQQARKNKA